MKPSRVAACLGTILGRDDVPVPPDDHPEPWTVWRGWLSERGLGLVPIAEPRRFNWPGPWIALLEGGDATVAFGAPPGRLDGGRFEEVVAGYLVAAADVALWAPRERAVTRTEGRVEAIAIAPDRERPMVTVAEAVAHAGRGLEGDRYHEGRGTFSSSHAVGHELTLVDAEAVEGVLAPVDARRNLITRGIDLNPLVGRRFMVGEVECVGRRLCEPCGHLQRLTEPGVLRALVHIGGLRADILAGGTIRAGDPVRPI
jgi:MOSC domain-containing protein YiiM